MEQGFEKNTTQLDGLNTINEIIINDLKLSKLLLKFVQLQVKIELKL